MLEKKEEIRGERWMVQGWITYLRSYFFSQVHMYMHYFFHKCTLACIMACIHIYESICIYIPIYYRYTYILNLEGKFACSERLKVYQYPTLHLLPLFFLIFCSFDSWSPSKRARFRIRSFVVGWNVPCRGSFCKVQVLK